MFKQGDENNIETYLSLKNSCGTDDYQKSCESLSSKRIMCDFVGLNFRYSVLIKMT